MAMEDGNWSMEYDSGNIPGLRISIIDEVVHLLS